MSIPLYQVENILYEVAEMNLKTKSTALAVLFVLERVDKKDAGYTPRLFLRFATQSTKCTAISTAKNIATFNNGIINGAIDFGMM